MPTGSYTALKISQYKPVPSLLVALSHSSLAKMISVGVLSAIAGTQIEQKDKNRIRKTGLFMIDSPALLR
jgi:hypothetical protein